MLGCLFGSKPLSELFDGPMTNVYVTMHHMVLHMDAEKVFTEQLISKVYSSNTRYRLSS